MSDGDLGRTTNFIWGIADHVLSVPPRKEQAAVVLGVEACTRELDAAILRTGSEIALIQEIRTRLIANVVTGKLDARAVAASLPAVPDLRFIEKPADDEDAAGDADEEEVTA